MLGCITAWFKPFAFCSYGCAHRRPFWIEGGREEKRGYLTYSIPIWENKEEGMGGEYFTQIPNFVQPEIEGFGGRGGSNEFTLSLLRTLDKVKVNHLFPFPSINLLSPSSMISKHSVKGFNMRCSGVCYLLTTLL